MTKITGMFEKSEGYGFIVPSEKDDHSSDYYVRSTNFGGAEDGDLVEAELVEAKKGKNKEAKITKIVNDRQQIVEKKGNIIGIYAQGRDGDFGFVDTLDGLQGYYVHNSNKKTAMDGDTVEASIKTFKGKKEAVIEKIVSRGDRLVVGTFQKAEGNFGFVVPKNEHIKTDIFVALTNAYGAQNGDIVGVEITKEGGKNPEGVIKEIIAKKGHNDKREEDIKTIAVEMGARISFPEDVEKEIEAIDEDVDPKAFEGRHDLRELFTFTIDGADAKDLDDAISLEVLDNGDFKLYVHIADVSYYVREDSPIDKEARARGTSIYLADRVIPMLPEKLSNNLCSLNPYTDKLTQTSEMIISAETGKTISSKTYESVIKSSFRLTYREVDEIVNGNVAAGDTLDFRGEATAELIKTIQNADTLKNTILKYREQVGVLNFDFPETYVTFDAEGNPNGVKEYPKHDSNKLIEVFMVSANEAVAKEFSRFPFMYRIHEEPKDFDIKELERKLQLFGVHFKFQKGTTKEFGELLEKVDSLEDAKRRFLEKIILRTLTQAMYSHINLGHFGLGLEYYSHFTSPIRRYPDLQIHRIIKEFLHHKLEGKRVEHYKHLLPEVAKTSSERERLSEKLEYKVRDYFMVKYYKDKIGQEFDAVISGLISKGFFISLPNTVEGFVELQRSQFDEEMQTHRVGGQKYRLGEDVKVRLIEANEELLRLNFEVVAKK